MSHESITLSNFSLVCVGPMFSGNIGSIARVAANFDLADIMLVKPTCNHLDKEARILATDCASHMLDKIKVVDTLSSAIADSNIAIAFTRRAGARRVPEITLEEISSFASDKVALVFGRENSGLTADEVGKCTHICSIPSSTTTPSLNLSHATSVVLSHLFREISEQTVNEPTGKSRLARIEEIDALNMHLAEVINDMELAEGNPNKMLAHMRRVLGRSRMSYRDLQIFHSFLRAIKKD